MFGSFKKDASSLKEYEKHIQQTHADLKDKAWCGADIVDWAFINIDHAVYNNKSNGRLVPCEKCVLEITKVLNPKLIGSHSDIITEYDAYRFNAKNVIFIKHKKYIKNLRRASILRNQLRRSRTLLSHFVNFPNFLKSLAKLNEERGNFVG